jgi:hypothetical protein
MAEIVTEEAKMLGEALSTVKIQVQQMKRHLVCFSVGTVTLPRDDRTTIIAHYPAGVRPAHGRA